MGVGEMTARDDLTWRLWDWLKKAHPKDGYLLRSEKGSEEINLCVWLWNSAEKQRQVDMVRFSLLDNDDLGL
jgi:hypothetical protein